MNLKILTMVLVLPAALGAGLASGCSSEPEGDSCAVGGEGCACTSGGSCDTGLTCLSQRCVKAPGGGGGPGSGGGPGLPGTQGSGGGTADFTGSWKYTTGSSTASCGVGGTMSEQLTETFRLKRGTDSPLIFLFNESCPLQLDVSANTASFRGGTSCTTVRDGGSVRLEISSGTIVLTGPNNAMVGFAGALTVTRGNALVCSYTINGTANRISPE
jgi:hypothetical protein